MDESANHSPPPQTPGPDRHADHDGVHGPDHELDTAGRTGFGPRPDRDRGIARDVDEHVRTLLAAEPSPGPMPAAVGDRIAAALAHEARLRVGPGPLTGDGPGAGTPAEEHDAAHDTVLGFAPRFDRRRRLHVAAAVAAATLVVGAAGSALHLVSRSNGAALFGEGFTSSAPSTGATGTAPRIHVQLGTTAYTGDSLAAQARDLLDHPGPPLHDLAAESPAIGPIGTEVGLASCLAGLGVAAAAPDTVTADLATYAGQPAAIVVVTHAGASTAWAVRRSCSATDPGILHAGTPVP